MLHCIHIFFFSPEHTKLDGEIHVRWNSFWTKPIWQLLHWWKISNERWNLGTYISKILNQNFFLCLTLCFNDCSFFFFLFLYKHMTTMCIVQLFRNPCNLKATDCNFFDRYVYPSGSWGAIDTDTAPKCFYELISALIKVNGLYWVLFF